MEGTGGREHKALDGGGKGRVNDRVKVLSRACFV